MKDSDKDGQAALQDSARGYLKQIGLSKRAIAVYELLLQKGKLTAQQVASETESFPSANYRLFYELEKRQLVRRSPGYPRTFSAVPLATGLQASLLSKTHSWQALLEPMNDLSAGNDQLEIIMGRQALYDAYVTYAKRAEHEIAIYSIGIAFSEKLASLQRATIKRGIRIRHVVQEFKLSNYHIVQKWLRAGVKVRYLKQPRGFHVTLFDHKLALITFSNPEDTEDRLTILTNNAAAARLFAAQFEAIWAEAKEIEPGSRKS